MNSKDFEPKFTMGPNESPPDSFASAEDDRVFWRRRGCLKTGFAKWVIERLCWKHIIRSISKKRLADAEGGGDKLSSQTAALMEVVRIKICPNMKTIMVY